MSSYGFYQLMTRQLDAVVPRLLEKVLAAGHRVLLVGDDRAVLQKLDVALWSHDAAYAAHPDRFGHRRPAPPKLPTAAWINQPSQEALIHSA